MGNCCISNKVDIEQNEIKLRESQINLEKHTVLNWRSSFKKGGSKKKIIVYSIKWLGVQV